MKTKTFLHYLELSYIFQSGHLSIIRGILHNDKNKLITTLDVYACGKYCQSI